MTHDELKQAEALLDQVASRDAKGYPKVIVKRGHEPALVRTADELKSYGAGWEEFQR